MAGFDLRPGLKSDADSAEKFTPLGPRWRKIATHRAIQGHRDLSIGQSKVLGESIQDLPISVDDDVSAGGSCFASARPDR